MNENLKPIEKLTPFTKMIMTIGTLPSSFYASMSYYESMVWLYEYLKNEVIPAVNNNGEAVEELQAKYLELKNYIDTYFDNLDVQEEINKKLDEMAEDGSLTVLIKSYVDPVINDYKSEINELMDAQDIVIATSIDEQNNAIDNFKTLINTQIAHIDEKVTNATSGSPKGVYETLSDLQNADPDHDYIYVVTATGNWYYYDTTLGAWTSGGTYQSTGITNNTITNEMLKNTYVQANIGKNKFNKNTAIDGIMVNPNNGLEQNNSSYFTSQYISIDNTKNYYISHLYNQQLFINYYTNDLTWISGQVLTNDSTLTIPATTSCLKITTLISRKDYMMLEEGTSATAFENFIYIPDGQIKDKLINTDNLFNLNDIENGKFISYLDGIARDNENYFSSNYIPVEPSNLYKFNIVGNFQLAFYTGSFTYISGVYYENTPTGLITTPATAQYIRFSNKNELINKIMFTKGETSPINYIPYGLKINELYLKENNIIKNIFYVGANERFTKLKDGIEEAIKYKSSILYVNEGTYDLYNEFGGSEFFENYDNTSSPGLILENDIHVIFATNSKVTFNYDGSNPTVVSRFSPFNSNTGDNKGGFIIENATIECSNCRYCFHDEKQGTTESYKSHFINCEFNITYTIDPTFMYSHLGIGMGLGKSADILIENCKFNTGLLIHNNASQSDTNAQSKVNVINNYLENNTMYLEHCGASEKITTMKISNNSLNSAIVVRQNAYLYVRDNINVLEWNNIIR